MTEVARLDDRRPGSYGFSDGAPIGTLVAAIQQLAMARSVDEIREIVRTAARELAGSDGATFVLRRGDECFYADEDAIAPLWKGQSFPLETCISGWAMLNRQAVAIRDIYADDRIPHDAYRPTFVKSLAMMPIRSIDPVGAIGIYWAEEHTPSEEELSLLRALADSTAVAMENVALYDELEQRVRDRTSELESANLKLAVEALGRQQELAELKRLNVALENFSWRAAHDLRSPLSVIATGIATFVRPGLGDEQRDEIVAVLEQQVGRAAQLIDDLLDLARASGTAKREPLDVRSLLAAIQDDVPEVQIEVGSVPETVNADPVSFRQAILNVARNAANYADGDGAAVLDVEARDEDGLVVFSLSDRGPGLPADMRKNVFKPFERGADAGKPGSGLGLAIVGAMAEAHGGRAWYEDRPGGGATFNVAIAAA